jgi:hypothetical protein
VGEDASGEKAETVPVLEEVIAAVIADLADDCSVDVAYFANVRCVDDDLTAVGDGRLTLVHAFGAGPEVGVHFGHDGKHAFCGRGDAHDVAHGREFRRAMPSVSRRAVVKACDAFVLSDEADKRVRHGNHGGGAVDNAADGRIDDADRVAAGGERA